MMALTVGAGRVSAQAIPLDSVSLGDTSVAHIVHLRDGSTLVGRILGLTGDSVLVSLEAGTIALPRSSVERVEQVLRQRIRNGVYWFENPHATRLLFSSTAFPLAKGTGYYSNTWLVMHTFAAGLTERLTLGGGLLWYPGVDLDQTLFYLMPKYTVVDREGGKLALGALVGLLPLDDISADAPASAGILYGVGTTGDRDNNFSLGLGWGYAGDEVANHPVIMLGGQTRSTRRISLITENWILPLSGRTEGIFSGGVRFLGEGLTVDLAFLRSLNGGAWAPWLGFAFRF